MNISRIALFIAPWCFVLLVAIGCSKRSDSSIRQESSDETSREKALTSLPPAPQVGEVDQLARYQTLIRSITDPADLHAALVPFYRKWGTRDGAAAVSHALLQHQSLLRDAFGGWLGTDAEAAREFVTGYEGAERVQGRLAENLMLALPEGDYGERGDWVAHFAEQKIGVRLVSQVAVGWGREQPDEALGWLGALPSGDARNGAIETVFQRWVADDPEVASTHLTRMVEGGAKDLAISSLAKSISRDDPEAALLWADTILDPDLRDRTNELLVKLTSARAGSAPPPTNF